MQRRTLFRVAGLMAALPALARRALGTPAARDPSDVYTRLGLRPIISAAGTYTHLGGSLMPPEVIAAMNDAAQGYLPIRDLTKGYRRTHRTTHRERGRAGDHWSCWRNFRWYVRLHREGRSRQSQASAIHRWNEERGGDTKAPSHRVDAAV
jgi:hypothetical protein